MNEHDDLFREMIDVNIKIDLSVLPKSVVEEIKELEELHKKRDWFLYIRN